MVKPQFDFQLLHKEENGTHTLTIIPSKKNHGYPELKLEITEGQWNDIKYHFTTAVDDVGYNRVEKVSYIC